MALSHTQLKSPTRRSQIGGMDMIFMVLMIVAILGVVVTYIFIGGDVIRDEAYADKIELFAADIAASNETANRAVDDQAKLIGTYKAAFAEANKDGQGNASAISYRPAGASKGESVKPTAMDTVIQAFLRYDKVINDLVAVHAGYDDLSARLALTAAASRKGYDEAYVANIAAVDKAVTNLRAALDNASKSFDDASGEAAEAHKTAFNTSESAFTNLEAFLRSAKLGRTGKERTESLDDALETVRDEMKRLNQVREEVLDYLGRRTGYMSSRDDFKGYVMVADKKNGWSWINLSQSDNVRRGITFDVQRPAKDGSGMLEVGRIQVNEVLSGGGSRCRVISTVAGRFPEKGDSLVQQDFTTEKYTYYCLIGDFGGKHSRFSRAQLKQMLKDHGFVVHNQPSDKTEVLVLGENWLNDPRIRKIDQEGQEFPHHLKINERDLLYQFGIIGPASGK